MHKAYNVSLPGGLPLPAWENKNTDMGSLYIQWSTSPVDGAMALLEPKKPPPKFKLTSNHGKEPLVKPAQPDGPHKLRYFEGIIMFLKRSMQMGGTATVYAESEANVWGRAGDGQVVSLAYEEQFE